MTIIGVNMARQVPPLFIIIFLLLSIQLISAEKNISMKFSDLETWMIKNSPEFMLTDQEKRLNKLTEYIEAGLPFTNPEFSYKNESLNDGGDSETEQEFEFSKVFEMPWIYSARRSGWRYWKSAIELSTQHRKNELLALMRSGYINLVLKRKNLQEYKNTGAILKGLLETVNRKEKEGFVSPMNRRMIELALSMMNIRIIEMEFELASSEKRWKQSAGINTDTKVELTTGISYIPLEINSLERILKLYRSSPGFRQWEFHGKELNEKIAVEKMGFLPEITLGAGFKKVTDGPKGPVFGISFGIPLLNRNTIMVKKAKLEKEIHNSRMAWSVRNSIDEITARYGIILKYRAALNGMKTPPVSPSIEILPLLDAFNEGTIDVNDLIGGIQLHMEGMKDFHSSLVRYYHNIFKIESRTGETIVTFN